MELTFASVVYPTETSQMNAVLMIRSIREFAGSLSDARIMLFTNSTLESFTSKVRDEFEHLNVEISCFKNNSVNLEFPFLGQVYAASLAEERAEKEGKCLAFLGTNSLILQEPNELILPLDIELGYRPVHHRLIGSLYHEPKDEFWNAIYEFCGISDEYIFPMTTHIDSQIIRPYFNAGFMIVSPEVRILRTWFERYTEVYMDEIFTSFYKKDEIYTIFIHQAILSGVILSLIKRKQMKELPFSYNYPIHLHNEDVTDMKPKLIDSLVTIRHEGFYREDDWMEKMESSNSLKNWLLGIITRIGRFQKN